MRLALDIITVPHGHSAVRLRASLRAATRLHAQYGLPELTTRIRGGELGAIFDTISEATDPATASRIVQDIVTNGVGKLDLLITPLVSYVFALVGKHVDDEPSTDEPSTAEDGIGDYLETLFEIATGWLGWSPADAWAATPSEIKIAQRGFISQRSQVLKAIFGGGEDADTDVDPRREVSAEQIQAGLATLRNHTGKAR